MAVPAATAVPAPIDPLAALSYADRCVV